VVWPPQQADHRMRAYRIAALLLAACSSPQQPPCPLGQCATVDAASGGADTGQADGTMGTPVLGYVIMAPPKIAADPAVKNRVIVIGTQPDGTPATDAMVVNIDRPGAGSYTRPSVTLGPLGATTYFSACDGSVPGCLGPVKLTAALASAPTQPVASVDIDIVPPIDVNPAAKCLAGGNILYLKGNDAIFSGETTYTTATWTFDDQYQEYLIVNVLPQAATTPFKLTFDTRSYAPIMIPDAYEDATKSYTTTAGLVRDHPAIDISAAASCSSVSGRFDVVEYSVSNSGVVVATYAFEQHCNGSTTTGVTGCFHYHQ